jgi:DNA invertase Pin-like site-specific DNA recombinase
VTCRVCGPHPALPAIRFRQFPVQNSLAIPAHLFTYSAQRRFELLLDWALDRLTREGVAKTFEYIKLLTSHGVQFVSFTEEHFRRTGPAGKLVIAVAVWIAKQERIRISERV